MTERPDLLSQRPAGRAGRSFRDPLSDLLRTVRLRGSAFFMVDATEPWVAAMPDGEKLAPALLPDAQQVLSFHIVARGSCWGGLLDGPAIHLDAGDILVFPRGDGYFMSAPHQVRVGPDLERSLSFIREMTAGRLPFVVPDGGDAAEGGVSRGDESRGRLSVVCGFLGCDVRPFNPLVATLPRLVHIRGSSRQRDDRLDRLIELTLAESAESTPGGESVRLRLSELMFVEVIRRYVANLPAQEAGWLAGLQDEFVGRALSLLHERAAHAWTLEGLADEVGLSRSAFADRFARMVGEPPIQYLTRWRMQLAARLLTDGSSKVGAVAQEIGYESEAAFSRAFKKETGLSPVAWRRR
jgi:AraC-like DNA-binding protein